MSNTRSVHALRLESVCRAYIGFVWMYKHTDALLNSKAAVGKVQAAVDAMVAKNPVLSGTLAQTKNAGQTVAIDFTSEPEKTSSVPVLHIKVNYNYSLVEESGFDQNRFPEIFGHLKCLTPEIQGLPVLRLRMFEFECGSLALAVLCHHILMDAYAAVKVAEGIAKECCGGQCGELWHDRSVIRKLIEGCGDSVSAEPSDDAWRHMDEIVARASEGQPAGQLWAIVDAKNKDCQIRVKQQGIVRLKSTTADSDGAGLSTNDLVLALLWRTWTRVLINLGSSYPGYTYTGGPVDMRQKISDLVSTDTGEYLGNMVLPHPVSAAKEFVVQEPLASVARFLGQHKRRATPLLYKQYVERIEAGAADILATVAMSDSPAIAFSNMTRLPVYSVDFGLDRAKCSADCVQLCSLESPLMAFAIDDNAGGFLINVVLPETVARAFANDPEFAQYADFIY
ncbi:hypothetical protein LPJ56_000791 [Coemansia sp. RSA 2599]|nr:hypothetical protein LPJ75_000424 [Coemansia sp. RSA 2598]KAJ1828905.1 hypothetical protein LPJ56_000791 [Coemansia sp. RSA 2599]